jgi:hypothetical protein
VNTETDRQGDRQMTKYTLDPRAVKTLKQVQSLIQALIKNETGAEAEVTICKRERDEVLVYTEELDKVPAIKSLMSQAREFISESFYDAEEDMPAGMTLSFTL